jgi:hypothetical protein
MNDNFLKPWAPVTRYAAELEAELRREVSEGHPLHGYSPSAVARRSDCDDVLFRLDGLEPRYAVVHLTWRGEPEPTNHWPATRLYETMDQWKDLCMVPDHREFAEPANGSGAATGPEITAGTIVVPQPRD